MVTLVPLVFKRRFSRSTINRAFLVRDKCHFPDKLEDSWLIRQREDEEVAGLFRNTVG